MGLQTLVTGRRFKNFMSKLYGIGASVVIIGALFKITHIPYANEMLFVGLITEAIIFFFSAFEPPHVEPDWSLVYPELAGMYHGADQTGLGTGKSAAGASVSTQLDKMLEDANIQPNMVERLGQGLENFSQSAAQMNDLTDVIKVNDKYAKNVEGATASVSKVAENLTALNKVYEAQLQASSAQVEANEKIQQSMQQFLGNLQSSIDATKQYEEGVAVMAKNVEALNKVYGKMLSAMSGAPKA